MKKNLTLLLLTFIAALSLKAQVVITEIMYNPPESGTDSLEFIEFHNPGSTDVDMTGYTFTVGTAITYSFTSGYILPAGGYAVVAKNSGAMSRQFGVNTLQFGVGGISNNGTTILLRNNGVTVDSVTYATGGAWPTTPNGRGPSLVLCNPASDNALAINWVASVTTTPVTINSFVLTGSPGAADAACGSATAPNLAFSAATYSVNEGAGSLTVTVNLTNPNSNPTSVDMTLAATGTATNGSDFTFTSPTTLTFPANSTTPQTVNITITDDTDIEGVESFSLNLTNATNGGVITTPNTNVTIVDNDVNAISGLVITEIMYNDPSAGTDVLEFIEIYNNTSNTVNLGGVYFSQGVTFTFPSTASLAAGAYTVVSADTMAMNLVFTQNFEHRFTGALTNTGEAIVLKDGLGNTIDSVFYSATAPWPSSPNGQGNSLVLCDYNSDNSNGANWLASTTNTGILVGATNLELICSPFAVDGVCASIGLPQLAFNLMADTIAENGGSYVAEVSITNANATATTVDVVVQVSGTATNGSDYTLAQPMTLTFPPSSAGSLQVPITIADDALVEGNERVVIRLDNAVNGFLVQGSEQFTLTIEDNDVVPVSGLVITEIMYNDPSSNIDTFEFIEIRNTNTTSVNLAGCHFSAGITYSFPPTVLGPDGYAVVALDTARLRRYFGFSTNHQWTGNLVNGGEAIVLRDAFGNGIDSVFYRSTGGWPTAANGNGRSLVLCDPTLDNSLAASWDVSIDSIGQVAVNSVLRTVWASPGRADLVCDTTRALFSFAVANVQVLENAGTATVTVNLANPSPVDTIYVDVAVAGGSATLGADFNGTFPATLQFLPNQTSQNLTISITDDALVEPTEVIALRLINPTGTALVDPSAQGMIVNILDNDTQPITGVVISEIMYNEASAIDTIEFVELYNTNSTPINMSGARLRSGVTFTFPNYTLPANSYVVIALDSAAMRTKLGVTTFQWNMGQLLNNSGEAVVLVDGLNNVVDSVNYDDVAPWPVSPDGLGTSLVLCDYAADNNVGSNWYASTYNRGYSVSVQFPTPATYQVYCSPSERDSVCLTINVNEGELANVSIYPNPNNGLFNVEIPHGKSAQIVIYNSIGQIVANQYLNEPVNNISLFNEPVGIYFVKVFIEGVTEWSTFKIIRH